MGSDADVISLNHFEPGVMSSSDQLMTETNPLIWLEVVIELVAPLLVSVTVSDKD